LGPLQPNYGTYFELGQLNVNDVPLPSLLERFIHTRLDPYADPDLFVGFPARRNLFAPPPAQELVRNLAAYRMAAVKYVLTAPGVRLSPPGFHLVFRSPSTWIYHLAGSMPYFSTAGSACHLMSGGRATVQVACSRPSRLIRRETYMPGWSAQVDGRGAPVRLVDGLFQAVTVPPGRHRVSFSFVPPYLLWGVLGLAAGLVWVTAAGLLGRRSAAPRALSPSDRAHEP
jgi:hypothetical protein